MNLTENQTKQLFNDPNFICIKRFDYSLKELLNKYPDGVPHRIIAQALHLTEPELEVFIQETLAKLKSLILGPNDEEN